MPERTIFRETAVAAHRRGGERDVVPRLVTRPVTIVRWLLLAVLLAAGASSWLVRVPAYVSAPGVLTGPGDVAPSGATAVLVLRPHDAVGVGVGRPVRLQAGSSAPVVQGEVTRVEPGVLTPQQARLRYPALGPDLVARPSVLVVVRLAAPPPSGSSPGGRLTAQVQDGTQPLIAFMAGAPARPAG